MRNILPIYLGLAYGLGVVTAAPTQPHLCCEALSQVLPGKVIQSSDNAYKSIQGTYWSAQNIAYAPGCFVQPTTAIDVSSAIQVLNQPEYQTLPGCKFAIRSGGHTPWAGAANIQGGVTIDLSKMKEVTVSADKRTVSVGPGNRWGEVYDKIELLGIAVSGGRWGNVGVGGLLTGGGLSFFQGREGLACDGVINHQVVLSDGTIVEANRNQNPDLHKALKGGNNNFGIVTRFDLKAFPQGQIWGGSIMGMPGSRSNGLAWFQDVANSSITDPNAMIMYSLQSILGLSMGGGLVTYSRPMVNPPVFHKLYNTSLISMASVTTYNAVAKMNALSTPAGMRNLWVTFTHVNNAAFMEEVIDIAASVSRSMPFLSGGIQLIFQPLWQAPRARAFAATGGNTLGLEESGDDLVIVLAMAAWLTQRDDDAVRAALKEFVDEAQKKAKEMRVHSPYIYLNYAADFQDVMGGYGDRSVSFMRATSAKYDPIQLFQRQVPGGFKLQRTDPTPSILPVSEEDQRKIL